jgi:transcription antitermination factor NusG
MVGDRIECLRASTTATGGGSHALMASLAALGQLPGSPADVDLPFEQDRLAVGLEPEGFSLMPILPAEPDMYPENLWDEASSPPLDSDRRWFCLHTKPRQEKATARELRIAGVPFYLPMMVHEDRTPAGRKTRSVLPLFCSYLFMYGDGTERVRALKGNRLVHVLEVADQTELVQDLRQIHQMLNSGLAIEPEQSAPVGSRVRIKSGPLSGLVGSVIRRGKKDRFLAVVNILGAGATVALEDWQVEILDD